MLSRETRVLVLMGGWSAEREVSLASGEAVRRGLETAGFPVRALDLAEPPDRFAAVRRLLDEVREFRADAVYLALHGPDGEDGTVQGLLELAGVPYTGSAVLASAVAMDKVFAKQVFVAARLTTPKFAVVPRGSAAGSPPLTLPVVVKPRSLGSSLGVSLVEEEAAYAPALDRAFAFGQDVLVEAYIAGVELQACVLDGEPLPLIQVVSANRLYDYEAKYVPGKSEHKVPAPVPRKQYEAAQKLGLAAYRALECRGAARVELIAEHTGTLYVLEVNTLPGMTVTSLLPEAAREAGMSFLDLVTRQVESAIAAAAPRGARAAAPAAGEAAA